jgi:putative aminopeptidase FrvX
MLKSTIAELCSIPSPTGYTLELQTKIVDIFSKIGFIARKTKKGSVLVQLNDTKDIQHPRETVILSAHIDTLGAMVRAVKSSGRLRMTAIGGYPFTNIITENCSVHTFDGRHYSGTVQQCRSSTHVYDDVNKVEKNDETVEIVLDEKVHSKEEVQKLGIETGNFVSFDPRTVVTDTGFIKSRHLDDKASAAILIILAKYIQEEKKVLNRKAYLLFTNYEEVGHGASAGIPDDVEEILAVDMGAVGDDLETDEYKVSICAKDTNGPYDYTMTGALIQMAKQAKLSYAVDIFPRYGSDASAALYSGKDIRFALIGPGVASSHGYERTHIDGLENTLRLISAYLSIDI